MTGRAAALLALAGLGAFGAGCEPYRIEYRRRPAYYQRLVEEPLPDRVVREDGTVVLYNARTDDLTPGLAEGEDSKHFQIREDAEDGAVVLRALVPEHVVANVLNCLRLEEYELLWDQMLAEDTRRAYAAAGQGAEEFSDFLRRHRAELARMLNRMRIGLATHEVVVDNVGGGVIECRFWPQIATLFKFKKISMVREGSALKLLRVE